VGAVNEDVGVEEGAGRVYVFRDGVLVHTLTEPSPQADAIFGAAVADAGDANGDGTHDYLVGQPGAEPNFVRAYVFDGITGAVLRTLVPPGPSAVFSFGFGLAAVGDLNGDGRPEHLVGAPFDDGGGVDFSGRA